MNLETYISKKIITRARAVPIDERITVGNEEFICIWSPRLNKYALVRVDGSGMSGLGWNSKLTYEDVYKYYSTCDVKIDGYHGIKPGTHVRGQASGDDYTFAFHCGTWRFINCKSGVTISSLEYDKPELDAREIRKLVAMPSNYDINV